MKILKDYVELIQLFKATKDELKIVIGEEKTLLFKFYEGVANQKFMTDADASKALYNKPPTYPAYKTLKSEFKKRLINSVLILDFKQITLNDVQQAYYNCQKNWATINILLGRQKIQAAVDLAQTTLETAKKFELTEIIVNVSKVLSSAYYLHRPLSNLGDKYAEIHKNAFELLQAEQLGEKLYRDFSKHLVKIKAVQRHLQPIALGYLSQLEPFTNKYDSYRLHIYTRLIKIYSFMCVNDYANALQVANDAILFLESKTFELKTQISFFLHQKTSCCIQLKKFEEGKLTALRSRQLISEGTHNWYKDGLIYIQLCLHIKDYKDAWRVYLEVIKHSNFNNQSLVVKEELSVIEIYLQYLISLNKIKVERSDRKWVSNFDAYQYINNLSFSQKDKRGMNVSVLIAHILWLLRDKDRSYDLIKSRIEALDKYRTRHVKEDKDAIRTNNFIKLINQLEKGSYKRNRVQKRCEKVLKDLKSTPIQIYNQSYSSEILPYEDIWELIMNSLS